MNEDNCIEKNHPNVKKCCKTRIRNIRLLNKRKLNNNNNKEQDNNENNFNQERFRFYLIFL